MSRTPARCWIASYARPEAYLPLARVILSNMGYAIVSADEWASRPEGAPALPHVRVVDEHRLDEIPDDPEALVPIILLTGRQGTRGDDPRILGAVKRPAGLHELYRLLQLALEEHPRSAPRVPTHLPARCRSREREWTASVISLSENGCLLRTAEPITLGSQIDIRFELPNHGPVETAAESAYQLVPDLGLVFHETKASFRHAILEFVERSLAP